MNIFSKVLYENILFNIFDLFFDECKVFIVSIVINSRIGIKIDIKTDINLRYN